MWSKVGQIVSDILQQVNTHLMVVGASYRRKVEECTGRHPRLET